MTIVGFFVVILPLGFFVVVVFQLGRFVVFPFVVDVVVFQFGRFVVVVLLGGFVVAPVVPPFVNKNKIVFSINKPLQRVIRSNSYIIFNDKSNSFFLAS